MDAAEFNQLIKRPGIGIASHFPKAGGLKSQIGKSSSKAKVRNAGEGSDSEQCVGHASVPSEKTTLNYSGQCVVRVKAFRRRLVDVDGNCIKYHLDFLRYIGAIKDDNDAAIRLIFEGQEKVDTLAEERLEVIVEYPEFNFDKPFINEPTNKSRKASPDLE